MNSRLTPKSLTFPGFQSHLRWNATETRGMLNFLGSIHRELDIRLLKRVKRLLSAEPRTPHKKKAYFCRNQPFLVDRDYKTGKNGGATAASLNAIFHYKTGENEKKKGQKRGTSCTHSHIYIYIHIGATATGTKTKNTKRVQQDNHYNMSSNKNHKVRNFHSCYRAPDPRMLLKGLWRGLWRVSEGSLKGPCPCLSWRTLQNPSKCLQEQFKNLSRRCWNRWCVRLPGGLKISSRVL